MRGIVISCSNFRTMLVHIMISKLFINESGFLEHIIPRSSFIFRKIVIFVQSIIVQLFVFRRLASFLIKTCRYRRRFNFLYSIPWSEDTRKLYIIKLLSWIFREVLLALRLKIFILAEVRFYLQIVNNPL